jgi:hypothetical protein
VIILAHAGAVYEILAPGAELAPDQRQAFASLRFIPRVGPFPAARPPSAHVPRPPPPTLSLAPITAGQGGAISVRAAGSGCRPNEMVELHVCWTGAPSPPRPHPHYTRYRLVSIVRATRRGILDALVTIPVPARAYVAYTVRVIAKDARIGNRLATTTMSRLIASRPGGGGTETIPGIEVQPHSPPVAQGVAYPFTLDTHCGVGFSVDFDGAFWDLADAAWADSNGNPPPRIGNPFQQGTMTLVDRNQARFDFTGDHIRFTRHLGPKVIPGACS